ncbi:MAG: AAA family ATPase [Lachnospiraceae bacterium]|nr:AAA family ATPase [Lachnospiraceae bacterium]
MFDEDASLIIRGLSLTWDKIDEDSYIRKIPALRELEHLQFSKAMTIFVGENGSGKSTLLEAMAVNYGFNPEGGTRNYQFSTYDSYSPLWNGIRLTKGISSTKYGYFLRAESFYNVATAEEAYSREDPLGRRQHFHERSHGESFLQLVQTGFCKRGLYLLDEPEAALSPQRQLTLLMELHRCVEEGSQIIMVTHSPILLGFPDAEILSFDGDGIHSISYEETESYQITRMFLDHKEQVLQRLIFSKDEELDTEDMEVMEDRKP